MKKKLLKVVFDAAVLAMIAITFPAVHSGSAATAGGLPPSVNPCGQASGSLGHTVQQFPGYLHRSVLQPFPSGPCGPAGWPSQKTGAVKSKGSVPESSGFLPMKVLDPGPIRPIITSTVALAGALVAAPFRLIETVFPPEEPRNSSCAPATMPSESRQPSSSCQNQVPPAVVAENRYPPVEPQSLLVGIVRLPFTLLER
ncbi:MAG: hypothetical protein QG577_2888 [Thermodesulfobacteriota bacterium]|nr:hypothetical protein [Thermodesulfobacteriota bacterium]